MKLILLGSILLLFSTRSHSEPVYEIVDVEISGAHRTSTAWLLEFLQLRPPLALSDSDCKALQQKLMTTHVFTAVDYKITPTISHPGGYVLSIQLREKWTTIPVIRGAMGGGTPLRVFGIYDTHVGGSLWTLGAETRKYGTAPNGFIVWARAPRWQDGRHFLSTEFWQLPRVRFAFNEKDDVIGNLSTDSQFLRFSLMRPLQRLDRITRRGDWKYGVRFDLKNTKPDSFSTLAAAQFMAEIAPTTQLTRELQILPILMYDDIVQSHLTMDGLSFFSGLGSIITDGNYENLSELELFVFKPIWQKLYGAFHIKIASTDSRRSTNLSYLGGLDSVRGYPDGVMFGNHSAYANFELRLPAMKSDNLLLQNIFFYDSGSAAFDWRNLSTKRRSSAGFGIRIGSPHVYRLVLRIDYAWSLNSANQGLSIGLNQFFEPYRPL